MNVTGMTRKEKVQLLMDIKSGTCQPSELVQRNLALLSTADLVSLERLCSRVEDGEQLKPEEEAEVNRIWQSCIVNNNNKTIYEASKVKTTED